MPSVLITGCSTGIGHATAELFAEHGWTVYAGSRHPDQMTFKNASIQKVEIDVNNHASIEKCFQKIGDLDCVVNNAGYGLLLPFEDTPAEEIEKMFQTNVFGLMEVSRRAARMMREKRSGIIINIGSVLSLIGMPWYAVYGATKWAVEGFSEAFAHELKPFNVHVKIVEPGGVKTHFHDVAYDSVRPPITADYRERFEKKHATRESKGDYDSPESVAELIWRAANDDSWRLRYSASQAKRVHFWQRVFGRDVLWRRLTSQ